MKKRVCEICKCEIEMERLEAIPDTRLCTQHAVEIRSLGGEFLMSGEQERTSKPGSLKHNYGGITTSKTRNVPALQRLRDKYEEERE